MSPGCSGVGTIVSRCLGFRGSLSCSVWVVGVTGRGLFTAGPRVLLWRRREWAVMGWAGPWPVDEHWWDPAEAARMARAQVLADEAPALLLLCRGGAWSVEGIYG